ncbi:MAG: phosphopantothenate/pantothenate synthetase family protein, partial [bacterium]
GAKLEVNLFHRLPGREKAIEAVLKEAGAREVLGVDGSATARIEEVFSDRRTVDPKGIYVADAVFVPLEDGDRTEGLVRIGKKVVAVDLNPMARTARFADVTIVDNVVRAMPLLVSEAERLKNESPEALREVVNSYSNRDALSDALKTMLERLGKLSEDGEAFGGWGNSETV